MRKIILVVAVMALSICITGCKKTPTEPVVQNKNLENMINEAKDASGYKEISQIADNYETYQYQISDDKNGVTVNVDAKVTVPEVDNMSVIRVRQKNLTQDFLDKTISHLAKDDTLYEGNVLFQEKNKEWVKSSGKLKKIDDLLKDNPKDSFYSWEKELNPNGEVYLGVTNGEDDHFMEIYMQNNEDYGNCFRFFKSKHGYMESFYSVATGGNSLGGWPADREPDMSDYLVYVPTEELHELTDETVTISQEAAAEIAGAFLKDMGLDDFICSASGLYCEVLMFQGDESEDVAYRKVYRFRYLRNIDGVFAENTGSKHTEGHSGDTYIKKDWPGESIEIQVNDDGIVKVLYEAPIETMDTIVEKASLKSFSEIKSIFENMIVIANAQELVEEETVVIDISSVELRYTRVSEEGSFDTGLLVPVWEFIGTMQSVYPDGSTETIQEVQYEAKSNMMSINAIDGTVIDEELGY